MAQTPVFHPAEGTTTPPQSTTDDLAPQQQQLLDDAALNQTRRLVALHRDGLADAEATVAAQAGAIRPTGSHRGLTAEIGMAAAAAGVAGGVAAIAAGSARAKLASRRSLLAGTGAAVAVGVLGGPAAAGAAGGKASTTTSTTIASATLEQSIMRRVSFGLTAQLEADVASARGWLRWIDLQLSGVSDSPGDTVDSWFFTRDWTSKQCGDWWATKVNSGDQAQIAEAHATLGYFRGARFLARAVHSKRQLQERMVDFWFNRFNIPSASPRLMWETEFDTLVRRNAMGSFYNLLTDVTTSGLMLTYLDAHVSTKTQLNENLGRELLELHTVGTGQYSEADVTNSARLLTGWSVSWSPDYARVYYPSWHWTGPVSVMGYSTANADSDGRTALQGLLQYLAFHPATAQRLAYQLIQYFCTDTPDPLHVQNVATAYLNNKTDIKATLRALFHDSRFALAGNRIANPMEDFLQSFRLRGNTPIKPTWKYASPDTAATLDTRYPHMLVQLSNLAGRQPLTWETPDGFPLDSHRYENAGSMLGSFYTHQWIAAGTWHPGFTCADWRNLIGFTSATTAANVVDKVARYIWRQPADENLRSAARALWGLADLSTTISPTDSRGTAVWMVASVALNHPLMLVR